VISQLNEIVRVKNEKWKMQNNYNYL
jgi:hypothetical protein